MADGLNGSGGSEMSDAPKIIMDLITKHVAESNIPSVQDALFSRLGIETYDDLQFVNFEKDLGEILSPIACRKLQAAVRSSTSNENSPVTPNTNATPSLMYQVPEELLNDDLKEAVMSKDAFVPNRIRLKIVSLVADNMKNKIRPTPISSDYDRVAKYLVRRFPGLKGEHGEGFEGLSKQLKDHVRYEQRADSAAGKHPARTGEVARKRPCAKQQYGVDYDRYLPNSYPEGENITCQDRRKQVMKEAFNTTEKDWPTISKDMKLTYASQREIIASGANMDTIIGEWPFIGKHKYLQRHFYELTGAVEADCLERLRSLVPKLMKFFRSEADKSKDGSCAISEKLRKAIVKYKKLDTRNGNSDVILIVQCLAIRLRDDLNKIFIHFEENVSWDEIHSSARLPADPVIVVLGETLIEGPKCFVFLDNRGLFFEHLDVTQAFLQYFMLHFVFGVAYNPKIASLMEFFQRDNFDISGKGSKVARPKGAKNPPTIQQKYDTFSRTFYQYCKKWSN